MFYQVGELVVEPLHERKHVLNICKSSVFDFFDQVTNEISLSFYVRLYL